MNINNEQRKALAGIVESNGNYDKFYANRYAKNEAVIINKANKFLADYIKLDDQIKELGEQHSTENKRRERQQEKEVSKLRDKLTAIEKQVNKIGGRINTGSRYSDTPANIEATDYGAKSDYDMWRKLIISKIWGAEDLETAKKAVDEFWAG